jgi:uncharacterized delta-60 repeat protein
MIFPAVMALMLTACGGGSSSDSSDEGGTQTNLISVQGRIINGPLVGAEVRLYTANRVLVGDTTTDENGSFSLDVTAQPPYRVITKDGVLDGDLYKGSLSAWCEDAASCNATPHTTILLALMDEKGFNHEDAVAHLATLWGFNQDPFLEPDSTNNVFEIDEAREVIAQGAGLESWVESVVNWTPGNVSNSPAGVPDGSTPLDLTVEKSSSKVTLRWNDIGADQYNLFFASDADFDPGSYSVYEGGTLRVDVKSPYDEVSLSGDTTYYFVLEARREDQLLNSSDKLSVSLDIMSPDPENPSNANTAPKYLLSDGTLTMKEGEAALAIQPDGKILAGGVRTVNAGDSDFYLARLNNNGSLDPEFSGGIVTTEVSEVERGTDWVRDIGLQEDGKIIMAGYSVNYGSDQYGLVLARYHLDGTLDTAFSEDGIKTSYSTSKNLYGHSIAIQGDNKILLGGVGSCTNRYSAGQCSLLARYRSDGSLDTSFAGSGLLISSIARGVTDMSLQADGKIVVLGNNNIPGNELATYATVVRYQSDGTLDNTFAQDGTIDTRIGWSNSGSSVTLQSDGKILVSGTVANEGDGRDFFIARYNGNGRLDASFADGGFVRTNFSPYSARAYSIALQADNKILVTGELLIGLQESLYTDLTIFSNKKVVVARYHDDGSLDSSFGSGGIVTRDLGSHLDIGYNIDVHADGKILVSGSTFIPVPEDSRSGGYTAAAFLRFLPNGQPDLGFNVRDKLAEDLEYTENGFPISLGEKIMVWDRELSAIDNYAGASLTLARQGGRNSEDVFLAGGQLDSFVEGGVLILSDKIIGICTRSSDGVLKLRFNSGATQEVVNETLSSIKYKNLSKNPEPFVNIEWVFSDGNTGAQGFGEALSTNDTTTVKLNSINNLPEGSNSTISIQRNSSYTLKANDFGFFDHEDGAALAAVRINSLPTKGFLKYDGAIVPAGLVFFPDDFANGRLVYSPERENSGQNYTSMGFNVKDSAGAYSSNQNYLTFSIED